MILFMPLMLGAWMSGFHSLAEEMLRCFRSTDAHVRFVEVVP